MLDKIANISSVGMTGTFGARNGDLVWLILSATLMFTGPALFALFYELAQDVKDHFKPKPLPVLQLKLGLPALKHT